VVQTLGWRISTPLTAEPKRPYLPNGTEHISACQADSIIEAARYAREIGLLLNAHCTIQWNGTDAQTDTDGSRFTKVREGLSKALDRRGIPLTAVWAREARELHPPVPETAFRVCTGRYGALRAS